MTRDRQSSQTTKPPRSRDAQRAEALRANLVRRKAQARAKADPSDKASAAQEQGDA